MVMSVLGKLLEAESELEMVCKGCGAPFSLLVMKEEYKLGCMKCCTAPVVSHSDMNEVVKKALQLERSGLMEPFAFLKAGKK
jgi:hypothetical protein